MDQASARCWERLSTRREYPMYIATLREPEGRPTGCLVGFATQVSIDPVRFLVCVSRANHSFVAARGATALALHIPATGERELATLFGALSGDDIDKFTLCRWSDGPRDLPILTDCPAVVAGPVIARHDMGDHLGLVLEVEYCRESGVVGQLSFGEVRDIEPGHPPAG